MGTIKQAIDFSKDLVNRQAGVNPDGAYGYQCKDLYDEILQRFCGISTMWGNAIDIPRLAKERGLNYIEDAWGVNPKAGDLIVYTVSYHSYGHVGLVIEDSDGVTIKTIEQNVDGNADSLEVGGVARYCTRGFNENGLKVIGWVRPPYDDYKTTNKTEVNRGRVKMPRYINTNLMDTGNLYSMKGVVIHNDAGSMTPEQYVEWLKGRDKSLGIAHYYINRDTIARVVDTFRIAYHTGDGVSPTSGNGNYIGYEVCQSMSANDKDFLANEDMTLMQATEDLLFYGLPINGDTVRLHHEFTPTSCLPVNTTELLTKQGWVSLANINVGDEIATYRLNDGAIIFDDVVYKVPVHKKDTYKTRDVEFTADHNMLWKSQAMKKYRLTQAKEMFTNKGRLVIPNAGVYTGKGLDITDGMLKLIVATQADGHYMKRSSGEIYGLEFHVSKERKVSLLTNILDEVGETYSHTIQSNGSHKIKVNNKTIVPKIEKYLDNKKFTWNLLELSPEQFELFYGMLLQFDGCVANNSYSSSIVENVNIVQALFSINGVGSKVTSNGTRVYFKSSERTIESTGKLTTSAKRKAQTDVSCVTVNTGLILIRQHGRTSVVGNCPHRSMSLHGNNTAIVKNYFIARMKHFASLGRTVEEMIKNSATTPSTPVKKSAKPTASFKVETINRETGDFAVRLYNIKSPDGISEVLFPAWTTDNGQDDLVWYKGVKQADGTFLLVISMSNHQNNTGEYNVHAYIKTPDGVNHGVGDSKFNLTDDIKGELVVTDVNPTDGTFLVTLRGVKTSNKLKQVLFPTWTTNKGQDDLKWYVGNLQPDGSYTYKVNIKDHGGEFGEYIIHAYGVTTLGARKGIGGTKVEFTQTKQTTPSGKPEVIIVSQDDIDVKHLILTKEEYEKLKGLK